jgi:hypothetical protein
LNWKKEFEAFLQANPGVEIHTFVVRQYHGQRTNFAVEITKRTGGLLIFFAVSYLIFHCQAKHTIWQSLRLCLHSADP